MLPYQKVLQAHKEEITPEQLEQIKNECEQMYKEASILDIAKKVIGIGGTVKSAPIAKPGIMKTILDTVKDDETKKEIVRYGVTTGIGGLIGGAMLVGKKLGESKKAEENYDNLIAEYPELLKDEKQNAKIKKMVFELTRIAPLAAANDVILKNYVLRGLESKLTVQDAFHATNISGKKMSIGPSPIANLIGGMAASSVGRNKHVDAIRSMSKEKVRDILTGAQFDSAYPEDAEKIKKIRENRFLEDPNSPKAMATHSDIPEEQWASVRERMLNERKKK